MTTDAEQLVTPEDVLELFQTKGSDRLRAQLEHKVISPIELAKAMHIRPQMVYTYIRKGVIESTTSTTQKVVIPLESALEWAQRYLNKKALKQERIERELRGER